MFGENGSSSVALCLGAPQRTVTTTNSRNKESLFHDDYAAKPRSPDPLHYSNRYNRIITDNPAAFHRQKGQLQEYMQMSVKNRALLPTQTVHRRLACVDDVISGRSTSPVGSERDAVIHKALAQSRVQAKLSPRTARRESAAIVDEQPWLQQEFTHVVDTYQRRMKALGLVSPRLHPQPPSHNTGNVKHSSNTPSTHTHTQTPSSRRRVITNPSPRRPSTLTNPATGNKDTDNNNNNNNTSPQPQAQPLAPVEYPWRQLVQHRVEEAALSHRKAVLQGPCVISPLSRRAVRDQARVCAEGLDYESPRMVKVCSKFTDSFESLLEPPTMVVRGGRALYPRKLAAPRASQPFSVSEKDEEIEEVLQEIGEFEATHIPPMPKIRVKV